MGLHPAVAVHEVSKKYRLFASKSHRLREALHPLRRTYHREFWALRDVTFDVPAGCTVGILGLNGSGKSTLLQIIASVLQPTTGTVEVAGRVAALLELGAGFNPDLTGRENAILNGTLMGLSREEIQARLPDIEAFADIGEFFEQPVKTYSSGMFMRAAFSAAMYVDPDVLIVDEALAVGDAKFQEKCFRRFRGFQQAGKTILFVTHDRSAVPRYCSMGILLHHGEVVEVGDPARVADLYGEILAFGELRRTESLPPPATDRGSIDAPALEGLEGVSSVEAFVANRIGEDRCPRNPTYNRYEHRFGNGRAEIVDYMIVTEGRINPTSIDAGAVADVYVKIQYRQDVDTPIVGIILKNTEGVIAFGVNTEWMRIRLRPGRAKDVLCYRFTLSLALSAGDWFVDLAVAESPTELCDNRAAVAHLYLAERERQYWGLARIDAAFAEVHETP